MEERDKIKANKYIKTVLTTGNEDGLANAFFRVLTLHMWCMVNKQLNVVECADPE